MTKLNYLTKEELEMDRRMVNLQIVLGLQSLFNHENPTKKDVCDLFDDIRAHERYILEKERTCKS